MFELAVYVAGVMADFRTSYAGGVLEGWNEPDLEEFLLDWVPRKVGLEDDDIEAALEAVSWVLRFLGESGRLELDAAERLGVRALALRPAFSRAARDPRNFGLAKSMTAAMAADGVEVTDQGAVQAWIDDFNALPEEGRIERVPVLASLPGGPAPTSAGDKRRAKTAAKAKKRERHARRRNRR